MNTHDILQDIAQLARETGAVLRQRISQKISQSTKSSSIDIVTAADKEAEQLITAHLHAHYPAHHVVGEEGGGSGADRDSATYFWYIDPIDGTTNFANRIPYFSISIALTDAQQQPIVGVVYDPIAGELFSAIKGAGASLNGQAIAVSSKTELLQCVLATGFPHDRHSNPDNNFVPFQNFMLRTRGVRRAGSAALDLAYVAAGRHDGFWELRLNPWDVLAGMLLVQEAGGAVTDYQGQRLPQPNRYEGSVASNGHIHQAMLAVLAESYNH